MTTTLPTNTAAVTALFAAHAAALEAYTVAFRARASNPDAPDSAEACARGILDLQQAAAAVRSAGWPLTTKDVAEGDLVGDGFTVALALRVDDEGRIALDNGRQMRRTECVTLTRNGVAFVRLETQSYFAPVLP